MSISKCNLASCVRPADDANGEGWCAEHNVEIRARKARMPDLTQVRLDDAVVHATEVRRKAEKYEREETYRKQVEGFTFEHSEAADVALLDSIDTKYDAIKRRIPFIGDPSGSFTRRVPFYDGNLLAIAAMTGHGKTTVMSAIAWRMLMHETVPLVITNETARREFFVSLACTYLGETYKRFSEFTEQQKNEVKAKVKQLSKQVRVVDQNSVPGGTTSVAGLKIILNKASELKPRAILLDYLQGVTEGYEPGATMHDVQRDAVEVIWDFIVRTEIPVVVFLQLHPAKEDSTLEERLKLGRHIITRATYAIEYIPQTRDPKTKQPIVPARAVWIPHKIREHGVPFEESLPFYTLFNGGRFSEPGTVEELVAEATKETETTDNAQANG